MAVTLRDNRDRPDFLCIGAQKAGTTWLWRNLAQHPDIWMPPRKELHYFDRSTSYPSPSHLAHRSPIKRVMMPGQCGKTLREIKKAILTPQHGLLRDLSWMLQYHGQRVSDDWYLSLFRQGYGKQRGEVTPEYAMLSRIEVEHIERLLPGLKMILLLRNPLERTWSHLRFEWSRGNLAKPERLADIKTFIDHPHQDLRNDYMRTIENWESVFGADRLFIGFYDEIEKNPLGLLSRVCSFLDVPATNFAEYARAEMRVNVSMQLAVPQEIATYMRARYTSQIERLGERFGGYASDWLREQSEEDSCTCVS